MDGFRHLQPDNATRSGRHCHRIMVHDAPGDAGQWGSRDDLLRLRRYPLGTPQDVAATRQRQEQPERKAAEAEPSKTRMRLRVRPIVPGSSPVIRRMSPHRHMPTETRPGLTVSPQRAPNRPGRVSVARPRAALDESRGAISTPSLQTVAPRSLLVMILKCLQRPGARY